MVESAEAYQNRKDALVEMSNDERGWIISLLVHAPRYRGCWYDNSITWLDDRPIPDDDVIWERFVTEKLKRDKIKHNIRVKEKYLESLKDGYMHSDGTVYDCEESDTNNLLVSLALYDIRNDHKIDNLKIKDRKGNVNTLELNEFKELAAAIMGRQVALKEAYWKDIL